MFISTVAERSKKHGSVKDNEIGKGFMIGANALPFATISWLASSQVAYSSTGMEINPVYEVGELFELGIQLSYVLLLLALLGVGTFFVIRQVLVRRELDLSAKELQVRISNLMLVFLFITTFKEITPPQMTIQTIMSGS